MGYYLVVDKIKDYVYFKNIYFIIFYIYVCKIFYNNCCNVLIVF